MGKISAGSSGSQRNKCHSSAQWTVSVVRSGKLMRMQCHFCNDKIDANGRSNMAMWKRALEQHWAQLGASTRVPAIQRCIHQLIWRKECQVAAFYRMEEAKWESQGEREGYLCLWSTECWHFHFWWTIIRSSSITNIIIINNKSYKRQMLCSRSTDGNHNCQAAWHWIWNRVTLSLF